MPLLLLLVGLVLTVTGAVRLSPFWGAAGTTSHMVSYALLLAGLTALTMIVPWTVIRLITGLQTALGDDRPQRGTR
jgi:hypothetical protein